MDWSEGSLHAYIESKDENIILWVTFPLLYSLQRERSIRNRFSSRSNAKTVPLGEIQKSSLLGTKDTPRNVVLFPGAAVASITYIALGDVWFHHRDLGEEGMVGNKML